MESEEVDEVSAFFVLVSSLTDVAGFDNAETFGAGAGDADPDGALPTVGAEL